MTGPILFSHETPREQLQQTGSVVTFRKTQRTTGDTWWRKTRTGEKCGDVHVAEIGTVDPSAEEELKYLVHNSGFESVDQWQDAIAEVNGSMPDSGWVYLVTDLADVQ